MKTSVIGAVGVIIILVIVGFVLMRRSETQELTADPSPEENFFVDENEGSADFGVIQEASPQASPLPEDANSPAPGASPAGETVTVSIDDTGFSPSNVTISLGTTVAFVNNGQALHWPASDTHPTHEILPELDSKRGLPTGETFSYTFTEAGIWQMHDHLNPSATGTIIVE